MMNLKRTMIVASAMLGSIAVGPGVAGAHPVGEPGSPNCFGQRISHGSSDHDLTPKERARALQFVVYQSGMVTPEEVAAFEETFGVVDQQVTVQIFAAFVRRNCSDDPFVPTP